MIALTAAQIAEAVSGTLSATLDPATVLVHVTPDSREVSAEGTLYVAKPGERADGHDFIDAALGAGAAAVLAERATHAPDAADHEPIRDQRLDRVDPEGGRRMPRLVTARGARSPAEP